MLEELRIENFAIIESIQLRFSPGLVTFTGETGAGKSILLDAILALIGGRVDSQVIRAGSDRAVVEAIFKLPESSKDIVINLLDREDLLDDTTYLSLAREIRREGRSIARINGRSVSVSLLREIGSYLVDIHGQSEHLSLLSIRNHLDLLDRYAKSEPLLADYRELYGKLLAIRKELRQLKKMDEEASRQTDLLNFQVNEIRSARLQAGEAEPLLLERDRLANAGSLADYAQQSLVLLEESTPETASISDLLGQVIQALHALSRIDSSQVELTSRVEDIAETISETALGLRDYIEEIEYNPRRLEQVEERLNLIQSLIRKYGGSIEAVIQYEQDASSRLDLITHAGERISELKIIEVDLLLRMAQASMALSHHRREASKSLSGAIEGQLKDLQMDGAKFRVSLEYQQKQEGLPLADGKTVAFDERGVDQVEFLIAPNPGEGFKPLAKIASGGETSRLMLALKNVLAQADHIPTLIFDEIDQGIGGRVGFVVGDKLWQLSRGHQVFCVTHLPQLAAFGDQHFRVIKRMDEGRTQTQVEMLDDSSRHEELAQMLGELSEVNLHAARDTLTQAEQRKKSH